MYNKMFKQYIYLLALMILGLIPSNNITVVLADAVNTKVENVDGITLKTLTADDVIRAKILDSIPLVDAAKVEMSNVVTTAELLVTANTWNVQANGNGAISKYVSQVQIDSITGEIEIMFNQANIGAIAPNSTLIFTPYIQTGSTPVQLANALTEAHTGVMDWGCASLTNAVSAGQSLPAITMGTLDPKYAPMECR